MKKTMILLSALLVFPISAQAHSVLEASTPAEGELVTEPVVAVALDFSAGIEEGSSMTMTMDGTAVDFSEVAVMDDQLIGTPAEVLEAGAYVVEYDVLSEDGHPIQGTLAFELHAGDEEAAQEEQAEESAEPEADETEVVETEQTDASGMEQAAASDPEAPRENNGSSMTLITAGIAIILLIAAVVLMRRKR